MNIPKIDNLRITKVTEDILLAHQIKPPFYFSCCDGLIILPKQDRNKKSLILDLNVEPNLINQIEEFFGPVSNYVCTHGHMDHMAHVYQWEKLGVKIHAPFPEHAYLLDLHNFYRGFRFDEALDFSVIKKFAQINGYQSCKKVNSFKPGDILKIEDVIIETIPLTGHSKGHIGFFIPEEKVIHISCLGFDLIEHDADGFGPWYGFKECSIEQYIKDINLVESIFLEQADFLTSSHSYVVKNPDTIPFVYMREKIGKNQSIVDQAITDLKVKSKMHISIEELLKLDLFFPKKKMKGFLRDIYNFWESGIIEKHIKNSNYLQ
jgi:glyoxylase-like metal-dependent hydrolase (beta-lactamase superfamily II)